MNKWITPGLVSMLVTASACYKNSGPYVSPVSSLDTFQFDVNQIPFDWNGVYAPGSFISAFLGGAPIAGNSRPAAADTTLWRLTAVDSNSYLILDFYVGTYLPTGTFSFVGHTSGSETGYPAFLGGTLCLTPHNPLALNDTWVVTEGDTVTVTVTGNADGYASGTFSAQLTNLTDGSAPLSLTGGVFRHLHVDARP